MIRGTYKAELVIDFYVREEDVPNIRKFDEIKSRITGGDLTEEIRSLLKEYVEEKEYCTLTLTQTSAEIRREPDETD